VFGDASPAPKVLTGDHTIGYFIMEEIPGNTTLLHSMNGDDADLAARDLIRFAALMGKLHGCTMGQEESFKAVQKQLDLTVLPQLDYHQYFQQSITTLEGLHIRITPAALDDIQQTVDFLSKPGAFSAFTHGDFVFQNCIDHQGNLHLIDFENAHFRHALWEGATLRMLFPSMTLNSVYRLPDPVWREAENQYRQVLSQSLPAASDDGLYEKAFTAVCAGWVLSLCQGHLSLETALTSDAPWVNFLRQRILSRIDQFVDTTREYGYFTGLGEQFGNLSAELKSQWPVEAHTLAYYPVFSQSD
jgi:hypothetical protein